MIPKRTLDKSKQSIIVDEAIELGESPVLAGFISGNPTQVLEKVDAKTKEFNFQRSLGRILSVKETKQREAKARQENLKLQEEV